MKTPTTPESATPDAIRHRAYLIWEQASCPEGKDLEFWLRAEQELAAEQLGGPPTPISSEPPAGAAPRPVPALAQPAVPPLKPNGTVAPIRPSKNASAPPNAGKPASVSRRSL